MFKPIERVAFEFWAGVGQTNDLEQWAESELRKDEPHPEACEAFNLSKKEAGEHALRLAMDISGFQPVSPKGEQWARELLKEFCSKLLSEQIAPMEFCHLVQLFDASFLGMRTLEDGMLEYPDWLGDLWNSCDWCDNTWNLRNSPHLVEEAEKVLNRET